MIISFLHGYAVPENKLAAEPARHGQENDDAE
jgi:hypothetical protein